MLEFLSLKQEVFGLDISDRSLKIAKLKKRGEFLSLASFGEIEIKSAGIIKQGEIKKEALFIKILKQALNDVKGEKLKTKYLIASLPEEKTLLQVIKIPLINKEELKSAVIYEAQNHIPLPIEDVYLDFQIIPPFFNKQDYYEALIVALPKKIVDPYVSCFKKAGLFPKALEIEPQAIVRALIKVKEDKSSSSAEPDDRKVRREKRTEFSSNPFAVARENETNQPSSFLLIHLGRTKTSLMIFSGYSLRLTFSLSISSENFSQAISKTMKIDFQEAEKLKLENGLKKEDEKGKEIFEAMIPILTDFIEQIKKYLGYYQTQTSQEFFSQKRKEISKILLCGGGAGLKGLDGFLTNELKIPVEIGNPWINILPQPLKEVPQLSFEESLKYTTSLGLALREFEEDKSSSRPFAAAREFEEDKSSSRTELLRSKSEGDR